MKPAAREPLVAIWPRKIHPARRGRKRAKIFPAVTDPALFARLRDYGVFAKIRSFSTDFTTRPPSRLTKISCRSLRRNKPGRLARSEYAGPIIRVPAVGVTVRYRVKPSAHMAGVKAPPVTPSHR